MLKKINETGIRLLEYKEELMKDYPQIVRDSLLLSLEQMVSDKVIDLNTYQVMKSTSENKESFVSYLLTKKEYIKSYDELFKEYDVYREELSEELKMQELHDLTTETIVEKDSIYVAKTFTLDEKFVMDYFGVEEKDLIKLMKRRGFMEKFATLRLTKVMSDIIKKGKSIISLIKLDSSLAYFNDSEDGFNIDFIMEISVDDLPILDKKTKIIAEIKDMKSLAENTYKNKMIN